MSKIAGYYRDAMDFRILTNGTVFKVVKRQQGADEDDRWCDADFACTAPTLEKAKELKASFERAMGGKWNMVVE